MKTKNNIIKNIHAVTAFFFLFYTLAGSFMPVALATPAPETATVPGTQATTSEQPSSAPMQAPQPVSAPLANTTAMLSGDDDNALKPASGPVNTQVSVITTPTAVPTATIANTTPTTTASTTPTTVVNNSGTSTPVSPKLDILVAPSQSPSPGTTTTNTNNKNIGGSPVLTQAPAPTTPAEINAALDLLALTERLTATMSQDTRYSFGNAQPPLIGSTAPLQTPLTLQYGQAAYWTTTGYVVPYRVSSTLTNLTVENIVYLQNFRLFPVTVPNVFGIGGNVARIRQSMIDAGLTPQLVTVGGQSYLRVATGDNSTTGNLVSNGQYLASQGTSGAITFYGSGLPPLNGVVVTNTATDGNTYTNLIPFTGGTWYTPPTPAPPAPQPAPGTPRRIYYEISYPGQAGQTAYENATNTYFRAGIDENVTGTRRIRYRII